MKVFGVLMASFCVFNLEYAKKLGGWSLYLTFFAYMKNMLWELSLDIEGANQLQF